MNLKLPDIEPAKPVSYDEPIARVGRVAEEAARSVQEAEVAKFELDKSEAVVQTQEATVQIAKGLNDALNLQKNNPYVSPEAVRNLFGGKPPEEIALTEDVAGPDGQFTKQERKTIPMHEVVPYLFQRQSAAILDNAVSGIKMKGVAQEFRIAAEKDVERARSEMMDWQRAQRLADFHVRTLAQLSQAAAGRNWNLYEAILNTPENGLGVQDREKLRAELPQLRTEANVLDRLRGSQTVQEIDSLLSDINTNRVKNEKDPQAPFLAPLSQEQQFQYASKANERKGEIIRDALAAEKRRKEEKFQSIARGLGDAIKLYEETGVPVSKNFAFGAMDTTEMDFSDFLTLKNAYEAALDPKRQTTWEVYNELSRLPPDELRKQNVISFLPYLAPTEYKEVTGWWRAAQEGKTKDKVIPDSVDNNIGAYVQGTLKIDPQKDPNKYNLYKAKLGRRYLQWRRENPDATFLYDNVPSLASGLFEGDKKTKDAAVGVVQSTLNAMGQEPTNEAVKEQLDAIDKEKPLVDKAWNYVSSDDIDEDTRAMVHADLVIPERRQKLAAQLRANGGNPNDEYQMVLRAVQNRAPPQSAERTKRMFEEDAKAKARGEANVLEAKRKAEVEAAKTAKQKEQDATYRAAPWKRTADEMEAEAVRKANTAVYSREYNRIYQQVDEEQKRSWPRTNFPNEQTIRAEAREIEMKGRTDREKAIRLQFQKDREAFEVFLENLKSGDSVAKWLNDKHNVVENFGSEWWAPWMNFPRYQDLRRKGEVF